MKYLNNCYLWHLDTSYLSLFAFSPEHMLLYTSEHILCRHCQAWQLLFIYVLLVIIEVLIPISCLLSLCMCHRDDYVATCILTILTMSHHHSICMPVDTPTRCLPYLITDFQIIKLFRLWLFQLSRLHKFQP